MALYAVADTLLGGMGCCRRCDIATGVEGVMMAHEFKVLL